MIVIDASVLAGFLRKEPDWEKLVNYIKNGKIIMLEKV
jgi:predicted nucleic acid-binding protein